MREIKKVSRVSARLEEIKRRRKSDRFTKGFRVQPKRL
jgi:hypothetical protein